MPESGYTYKLENDINYFKFYGRVSFDIIDELYNKFEEIEKSNNPKIIFDLTEATWICSRGLGFLTEAAKLGIFNGKKIAIISDNKNIKDLFNLIGINEITEIFVNKEEAYRYYNKQ